MSAVPGEVSLRSVLAARVCLARRTHSSARWYVPGCEPGVTALSMTAKWPTGVAARQRDRSSRSAVTVNAVSANGDRDHPCHTSHGRIRAVHLLPPMARGPEPCDC
jgi:hypothetical protein